MATLKPDGSIEFASVDELIKYQQQMRPALKVSPRPHAVPPAVQQKPGVANSGIDLLVRLKGKIGKALDSKDMVTLLQVKSAPGVGPRLKKLEEILNAQGIALSDYLEAKKTATGTVVWTPKKAYP